MPELKPQSHQKKKKKVTFQQLLIEYIIIVHVIIVNNLLLKTMNVIVNYTLSQRCTHRKNKFIHSSVLSTVSGIHWGSWNLSPNNNRGLLYWLRVLFFVVALVWFTFFVVGFCFGGTGV
jgi:hypothetical protein